MSVPDLVGWIVFGVTVGIPAVMFLGIVFGPKGWSRDS